MAEVRSWAFSVCVAMVVCGIARTLVPQGAMQKVFGITVSAFMLCGMLSPILLQKPELRLELESMSAEEMQSRAEQLTEAAFSQGERSVKDGVKKIVADQLLEMGINCREITIHMNQSGQSEWEILQVDIELELADQGEGPRIRRELRDSLGLDVRLTFAGTGGEVDEAESKGGA